MISWEKAWHHALYGPTGFYYRPEGPIGHFRTAAHAAAPDLARALRRLADEHHCTAIVDVGAGRGELLSAFAATPGPGHASLGLWGVDVVPRPARLNPAVGWSAGLAALPDRVLAGALVIAWELLDVIPMPILEWDAEGRLREVLVEPATGREGLGGPAAAADLAWCERWWPTGSDREGGGSEEGDRVEVGDPRDRFWAELVHRSAAAGARALLAVDYGHLRAARPPLGSLTGFRAGRALPPRPDGSMDLTAHVAIDAVAAAGRAAGASDSGLTTQQEALRALGVRHRELLDPGGFGGFSWLLQTLEPSAPADPADPVKESERSDQPADSAQDEG
jgi:SAM-dependent MidA family methyltransferase